MAVQRLSKFILLVGLLLIIFMINFSIMIDPADRKESVLKDSHWLQMAIDLEENELWKQPTLTINVDFGIQPLLKESPE